MHTLLPKPAAGVSHRLLMDLGREQRDVFGQLGRSHQWKKTTLMRKCRCFANGKLEVRLVSVIGTESRVPQVEWTLFHLAFCQCPGAPSERKIITKKYLRGVRSTGSLPDGDNHGPSNPRPDSRTICLFASISYVCAHTSPNKHTPELRILLCTPPSQGTLWFVLIHKLQFNCIKPPKGFPRPPLSSAMSLHHCGERTLSLVYLCFYWVGMGNNIIFNLWGGMNTQEEEGVSGLLELVSRQL